jgi:hypothetical protein
MGKRRRVGPGACVGQGSAFAVIRRANRACCGVDVVVVLVVGVVSVLRGGSCEARRKMRWFRRNKSTPGQGSVPSIRHTRVRLHGLGSVDLHRARWSNCALSTSPCAVTSTSSGDDRVYGDIHSKSQRKIRIFLSTHKQRLNSPFKFVLKRETPYSI